MSDERREEGFEAWLARRSAARMAASVAEPAQPVAPTRSSLSRVERRRSAVPSVSPGGRNDAVAWAKAMLAQPDTVFLDTETTGFGPRAEIIDIGIVDASGKVLLDTLIRPSSPIPASTSRVHGLFDHDVAGAPDWRQIYPDVFRLLAGARVVVYNAPFDSTMVTANCQRVGLPVPGARWHCAMRQYAAYAGPRPARPGRGVGRFYKLDLAAAAFDIAPGGHRALADADVCRRVVVGMAGGE